MKVEIKIPAMGESVVEAIVSSILKPNGTVVKADEEILELETEKVNQVLYAPTAGVLTLTVKLQDTVKIGQVIGYIDTEAKGQSTAASITKEAPKAATPLPEPMKMQPVHENNADATGARKSVDSFVAEVTQPKAAAPTPIPATPAPKITTKEGTATRKKMTSLRKTIAQKLVEVKNQTAMLTTFNEIDMSAVMAIREKEKENFQKRYGVKLGFMSFFVKGVVAALKAVPEINAMIDGDEIITFQTYDIGVAVSTEKGLLVPVVRDCDKLSFGDIELAIDGYAKKARAGKVAVDDMRGGTFTITNGGVFGSLLSTPILNPPQSGILGMHAIVKRPVAVKDEVVIRPMMYVALSYDHRIVDGKEAVLFLVNLKQALEEPARLLLDL